MTTQFYKGIAFAIGACLIWGMIFVVPQFMVGFTPLEIAMGRYFTFGMLSLLILLRARSQGNCHYPFGIWVRAVCFSLIYSFGYYIFLVLALRYATPAICALILGISPIAIAFYGNWTERECSYQSLILPSFLILVGLVAINVPHLMLSTNPSTYVMGLICAVWALLGWSWYVVANSRFLKSHPEVHSSDWSTVMGVSTLFWVAVFGITAGLFFEDQLDMRKYVTPGPQLVSFLIGCAVLGIVCSWVGSFFWNKASLYLPVSFAGQLTIFETIFGVCFVYMLEQNLPPAMECLGICFLLMAIIYGIRASTRIAEETIPLS